MSVCGVASPPLLNERTESGRRRSSPRPSGELDVGQIAVRRAPRTRWRIMRRRSSVRAATTYSVSTVIEVAANPERPGPHAALLVVAGACVSRTAAARRSGPTTSQRQSGAPNAPVRPALGSDLCSIWPALRDGGGTDRGGSSRRLRPQQGAGDDGDAVGASVGETSGGDHDGVEEFVADLLVEPSQVSDRVIVDRG